jgi:Protein of unknown function (DUF1629)
MFPRRIKIEGTALLPPSPIPIFPEGVEIDEKVVVIPPVPPWKPSNAEESTALYQNPLLQDQRYWHMDDAFEKHPRDLTGNTWVNKPALMGHYGGGVGLQACADPCIFKFPVVAEKIKRWPDFFSYGGIFIVSARLLDIFRSFDEAALDIKPLLVLDKNDQEARPGYCIMDVIRIIDAVDYANSTIRFLGPTLYNDELIPMKVNGYEAVRILDDIDPSFHIFRQRHNGRGHNVIVSRALKEAIRSAKPKITNVGLYNMARGL